MYRAGRLIRGAQLKTDRLMIMDSKWNKGGSTTGGYESPHKDEYDRMVEKIKAKRKALSKSIWTDEPLLKPYKSIWIDDEEKTEPKEPQQSEQEPVKAEQATLEPQETMETPQAQEDKSQQQEEPKPDPFSAHTPEYFEPNPVIRDARHEQLAFGVTPEHYDEVIMPFVNEYSVERKLPDQRKHISRKPKANAAVNNAVRRSVSGGARPEADKKSENAQVVVHKLRHERFFDDEGEPLVRHDPQKSNRKRPKMVPLSQRREKKHAAEMLADKPDDDDGEKE